MASCSESFFLASLSIDCSWLSSFSIVSRCVAFDDWRSAADSLGNPAGDLTPGLAAGTTETRCCCTMRQSLPTVSSLRLVTCVRPLPSLQLQMVSTWARTGAAVIAAALIIRASGAPMRDMDKKAPEIKYLSLCHKWSFLKSPSQTKRTGRSATCVSVLPLTRKAGYRLRAVIHVEFHRM